MYYRVIKSILLREYSLFSSVSGFLLVVSVHKHVSLGGMSVKVAEEEYVPALKGLLHHQLRVVQHWVLLTARPNPLTVKISAYQ